MRSHLEFGKETSASEEEYRKHLTRAAKIQGTEEEHDAAYLFMACPLCGARAGADKHLLGHISSHVERLALMSLPAAGWRAKRPAVVDVADLDSDAETSSSGESSFGEALSIAGGTASPRSPVRGRGSVPVTKHKMDESNGRCRRTRLPRRTGWVEKMYCIVQS